MLLSEMVRKLKEERQLINDATERSSTSTTYTTVASYNITLSAPSMLIYRFLMRVSSGSGFVRFKIGTLYVGGESTSIIGDVPKSGFFALAAGSYTIEVQLQSPTGNTVYIKNLMIGAVSFSDMALVALRNYGSANISLQSRKICIGLTARATLMIQVYSSSAPTVTVDGSTISPVTISAGSPAELTTHGEKYVYVVSVEVGSRTINVSAGNYSAVMCPWLLPVSDSEIVSLSFPQGSTLYIILEPLFSNNFTKTIKLGKSRAVSFGDTMDYYSIASGTGILNWNYTFESVNVEQVALLISGYANCVSIIALDVRT